MVNIEKVKEGRNETAENNVMIFPYVEQEEEAVDGYIDNQDRLITLHDEPQEEAF
jgi:hypothetical protein